jgi:glycosyltransferase involved in cell wall biosynthesis
MLQRTLLAIPVYDEALHLPAVLTGVLKVVDRMDLLIIDDGSTDSTTGVLQSFGVHALHHIQNLGKGASLLHAIQYAKEKKYDWLLCMDGDGQHDPSDIPRFLERIQRNEADIILGNRQERAGRMPVHRQLSNGITSLIISLLINKTGRIQDSQCGFRALRLSGLQTKWFKEKGFQFESELLIVLGRKGFALQHIPVGTRYGRQKTRIHLFHDTLRFLKLAIKSLW